MMITSCVCGLIALTGGGEDNEPELEYFEKIVGEAFQKADKDNSGLVSFDEFVLWARSNRDIMTSLEIMNKVNAESKVQVIIFCKLYCMYYILKFIIFSSYDHHVYSLPSLRIIV